MASSPPVERDVYWASLDGDELAAELYDRTRRFYQRLPNTYFYQRAVAGWAQVNGLPNGANPFDVSQLGQGGENGQLAFASANHTSNIATNLLNITTQNRVGWKAVATNSDESSIASQEFCEAVLNYTLNHEGLETVFTRAAAGAIQCGFVWCGSEWDARYGKVYDVDPVTKTPLYEGKPVFSTSMAWDVAFDTDLRNPDDHQWLIRRGLVNRWDLIAKCAENDDDLKQEILGAQDETLGWLSERGGYSSGLGQKRGGPKSDLIPVWTFFHAPSPALPNGRWVQFLNGRTLLAPASPLPYDSLPLVPVMAGEMLDTAYGTSPIHQILALQAAQDQLIGAVLSNNLNLARQILCVAEGEDFSVSQLTEGLAVLAVSKDASGALTVPKAINLVQSSPETMNLIGTLTQAMESVSGVNAVSRGDPQVQAKLSGAAMALIDSMLLRYSSGLQASYARCVERIGNLYVQNLKKFARSPRLALIAGKAKGFTQKYFTGSDLESIDRVTVAAGNANTRSPAFRLQMAQDLLEKNLISPQEYLTVAETGQIESATETEDAIQAGIRAENELMREGEIPTALAYDPHPEHLKSHLSLLADPDARKNPKTVAAVLKHVEGHKLAWQQADPDLLPALGIPPAPQPPQPAAPAPAPSPEPAPAPGAPPPEAPSPVTTPPAVVGGPGMPNLPTNPATGQTYDPNAGGQ